MSVSGWKALPDVREWSRHPPGIAGVAGRPIWMSGSGWEIDPDVREWSGGLLGCPGVVGRPYRMSGTSSGVSVSGQEVLPDVH